MKKLSAYLSMFATPARLYASVTELLTGSLLHLMLAHVISLHKSSVLVPHAVRDALFVLIKAVDAACMASNFSCICTVMRFMLVWINGLIWAVVSPKSKAAPAFCGHPFSWELYSGILTDFYWCCSVCALMWLLVWSDAAVVSIRETEDFLL